ncbi:MAG: YajQ family cyclic di-GMP-binding protein [Candidatus Omnitrophica bacterium CG07_land_8_20_14_0_80_50_8]|nr:MAG: YajQ family cyclic di-GMP-binding protein [Candidatus Omnitrophica bacterium CG07_land_8_20_14_0_80_50_8]
MGSKDHSFDIVSEVNLQELDNAVQQAKKELAQRFDFKGSDSSIDLDKIEETITLKTENEYRLKTLVDLLQTKCVKRGVSLKALKFETLETGMVGGSVKQVVTIQSGIPSDKAKEIIKSIKESKIKVQAQIQEDQVRVQSPKIDDLQAIIAYIKQKDFDVDLQCLNFR